VREFLKLLNVSLETLHAARETRTDARISVVAVPFRPRAADATWSDPSLTMDLV
jgi:hypothetical protein